MAFEGSNSQVLLFKPQCYFTQDEDNSHLMGTGTTGYFPRYGSTTRVSGGIVNVPWKDDDTGYYSSIQSLVKIDTFEEKEFDQANWHEDGNCFVFGLEGVSLVSIDIKQFSEL